MQPTEIHPGDVLAGKYRVRAILGRNHGLLVDAFHTEFDQRVIIKVLLPGAGDSKEIERFRREARTLAKLSSEHSARIIDVGSESDGSFFLVREYLEGTDLARYLRTHGPLALSDAVLLVLQAAEAVAETHSHGIIVREIQPSTLFLTQRPGGAPLIKLIDFGTAKLMNAAVAPGAGGELTATAMFGCSPYSSPEMIRKAKNADARTDVWSLGAILYELLTGRAPFSGEAAYLMLQITREEPAPPSHLAPHLPPEIDQIIGWALAKDVDARFKNMHAFAHALRPYAPPEGQLLVDRIGQIAEQAKRRPKPASLPPPSAPPRSPASQPAPPLPAIPPPSAPPRSSASRRNEDSFTREYIPAAPASSSHAAGAPAFVEETTARMGDPFATPPPQVPTIPPPAASKPSSQHPVGHNGGSPGMPGSAPIPPSIPSSPVPAMPSSPAPAMPSSPPPSGFAASAVPAARGSEPGYSMPDVPTNARIAGYGAAARKALLDKRIVVGALAAVAVLLPAMIAILVMSRGKGPDAGVDSASSTAAVTVPISATTAAPVPPPATTPAPTTAAQPAPAPTADPATTAPAPPATQEPVASGPSPSPNAKKASGGGAQPAPKPEPPKPAKPDPPATTGGGDPGTLMAVALGGTCAFSVNGSSKGTSSSIRVTLPPGSYSVMCKPAGGALRSKTITVKSGQTAMATFKL